MVDKDSKAKDTSSSFFHQGRLINVEIAKNNSYNLVLQNEKGRIQEVCRVEVFDRSGCRVGDLVRLEVLSNQISIQKLTPCCHNNPLASSYLKNGSSESHYILRLKQRAQILTEIRNFFNGQGFTEVETPLLANSPGLEPHLDAFVTSYIDYQQKEHPYYLPTSPEFAMKRLLATGMEKIYQISKCFRNGGELSRDHQPEFTMIEWYRAYSDYKHIMDDVEHLFTHLLAQLPFVPAAFKDLFKAGWERITVKTAMEKYAGVDIDTDLTRDKLAQAASELDIHITADDNYEDLFFKIFLEKVEAYLGSERPTILYDYPASMSALATVKKDNPLVCERFEVYIKGIELGNAFNELTNFAEHQQRFSEFIEEKKQLGKPLYPIDESFMEAIAMGIPPSGGIAMGIDRMVALLCGESEIAGIIAFPKRFS